jgi:hypothetical protein
MKTRVLVCLKPPSATGQDQPRPGDFTGTARRRVYNPLTFGQIVPLRASATIFPERQKAPHIRDFSSNEP